MIALKVTSQIYGAKNPLISLPPNSPGNQFRTSSGFFRDTSGITTNSNTMHCNWQNNVKIAIQIGKQVYSNHGMSTPKTGANASEIPIHNHKNTVWMYFIKPMVNHGMSNYLSLPQLVSEHQISGCQGARLPPRPSAKQAACKTS